MKRKSILMRVSAAVLAGVMLLSGCAAEDNYDDDEASGSRKKKTSSTEPAAEETTTDTREDEEGRDIEITTDPVYSSLVEYLDSELREKVDSSIEVTKKIKWMGCWEIDETTAAAELFKQVYGTPEANNGDNIFEYIKVEYAARYDELTKAVYSGDSPDIFPFEISNFPYAAYDGLFSPIDDYIDFSDPAWDGTRDILKQFRWGGKNYCAMTALEIDQVMWYRRSVFAEAGMEDPCELYKMGEWTWDTFLDVCERWQRNGEDRYAIDGYFVPEKLLLTTGVPLIGIGEDGRLYDNLYNADIERSMTNLIDILCKENYRYPRHKLNDWIININEWINGNILFMAMEYTAYKDTFQPYINHNQWENTEIFCVPFPRDPQADKYYQSFKNFCYMLVKGSRNTEGFTAWTQCLLATANDKETARLSREQLKSNYDYSDELLDLFDDMLTDGRLTPIFDFSSGIGQDMADSNDFYSSISSLTQVPYLTCADSLGNPATFAILRTDNEKIIRDRISSLNNSLD